MNFTRRLSRTAASAAVVCLCIGATAVAPLSSAADCGTSTYYFKPNGYYFGRGDFCLRSGDYRAEFQSDQNFVIYRGDKPIWATKTDRGGLDLLLHPTGLNMQGDGNAVIYRNNYRPTADGGPGITTVGGVDRASNTAPRRPQHRMVMQADGNLVIYAGSGGSTAALWSSGTGR